jgi:hypothetical protein
VQPVSLKCGKNTGELVACGAAASGEGVGVTLQDRSVIGVVDRLTLLEFLYLFAPLLTFPS